MRPGVGACGPKLLYPDGRVQSAGIVTGIMGFAGSMMVAERGDDPGYMGRAVLTQDMSAVTAACMMVQRKAFLKAGGFPDEFTVALGDVDFCLSLRDAGYRIVFEPAAVMIHHESLTRGAEDSKEKKKRFRAEKEGFRKKRVKILKEGDPAYNPNLSRRRCDWSQQT
jgi:GT2 family glycosyltransferase